MNGNFGSAGPDCDSGLRIAENIVGHLQLDALLNRQNWAVEDWQISRRQRTIVTVPGAFC
jgi:hypothetical protein